MTPTQLPLTPTGARSTGLELKEQGQNSLERHPWLERAREWAEWYCRTYGTFTSDNLHHVIEEPPHRNCWGALFHDKRFVATGERVRSARAEAHGREIRVWRLA